MHRERLYILEEMPVAGAIYRLAIPTILSMVVQILYNLADTFFVGMLNDPNQIAAVSISMPVFMITMALAGLFGNGGASYLSRLLGQKEIEAARETATVSLVFCGIAAVIVSIVCMVSLRGLLPLIGASSQTGGYAYSYLRVIILGSPVIMLNFCMSQLLRAEGAARINLNGMIVGTAVNMVFDPICILGLHWGVTGAAVATVFGNACALIYYIYYYRTKPCLAAPSIHHLVFRKHSFTRIMAIGIPMSLGQIMMSFGNAISNRMVASYGDLHVAGFGVAMRVIMVPIFLFIGLSMGIQPLIGYCYGASNQERLRKVVRTSMIMGLAMSGFFIVTFLLFSKYMIAVFIRDRQVIALGSLVLNAMVVAFPFAAMQMQFLISLQAMGKAMASLIVSLSRQGLVYIPALFILKAFFGYEGIVFALPIADIGTTIIAFVLLRRAIAKMRSSQHLPGDRVDSPVN
jgi:multidrug efflux pump